jgi:SNF2 family DNA or RNA helicase
MKDSIEERIMNLHAEKRALADSLFSGEEFGGAWSVEDLMQLLRA